MKKNSIKKNCNVFSVDFNPIDILDIHKYWMKGTWYKIVLGFIKKIFIGLLIATVSACNHAFC